MLSANLTPQVLKNGSVRHVAMALLLFPLHICHNAVAYSSADDTVNLGELNQSRERANVALTQTPGNMTLLDRRAQ